MRLCRGWKESIDHIFKQVQSSLGYRFTQRFYFFLKLLEFERQNALEDSSSLVVMGECEVNNIELALHSFADFSPTTSWRTHSANELNVQNELEKFPLLSIEPSVVVYPLSHQLKRRLRSESIFPGHVQVVNENDHLFSVRNHLCFGPSYQFHFNHFLSFERIRLGAKYNIHRSVLIV